MGGVYRDLLKHSSIYGVGQVLSRLASFLLLPLYTSCLTLQDYGCIAILDLTTTIFGIVIGAGMIQAVGRFHFAATSEAERDRIWWTGLWFQVALATLVLAPAWLGRKSLAEWTLGPEILRGDFFFALVLPTLWLDIVGRLPEGHLRVLKRSLTTVAVSLFQLVANVGLNIFFLVGMEMGVEGILLGNLLARAVVTLLLLGSFVIHRQRCRATAAEAAIQPHEMGVHARARIRLLLELCRFGAPLIVTTLLAALMHAADRYLLRLFVDLEQVGIYSFAYQVGQAVNGLVLLPFSAIWAVVLYEVAELPDAKRVFGRIFEYYVRGFALVMLGVSLFARPLLARLVAEEYLGASAFIPLICLGFVFFGLHEHFKVPAFLANQTVQLLPAYFVAALVNVVGNLLLIPVLGLYGAAVTSVVTYACYSFVGLWRYRRIDTYEYPLLRCGGVLAGMIASYAAWAAFDSIGGDEWSSLAVASTIWVAWTVYVTAPIVRQLPWKSRRSTVPEPRQRRFAA